VQSPQENLWLQPAIQHLDKVIEVFGTSQQRSVTRHYLLLPSSLPTVSLYI
jgi:hypothetical protein